MGFIGLPGVVGRLSKGSNMNIFELHEQMTGHLGIEGEKLDAQVRSKLERVIEKHKARLK